MGVVRTVHIKLDECDATVVANLWRSAAHQALSISQPIELWDVQAKHSSFYNEYTVHVNMPYEVKVGEGRSTIEVTLEGVVSVGESVCVLMTTDSSTVNIKSKIIKQRLPVESLTEDALIEILPISLTYKAEPGSDTVDVVSTIKNMLLLV